MNTRTTAKAIPVSRIGQRRQVVIPKVVFEALQLREGDFVEVTMDRGNLRLRPKRLVDIGDDVLTSREAATLLRGEAEIKAGRSKPWRTVKHDLGR
jgi:AbrB family looped-hinge helix DNA binding protein